MDCDIDGMADDYLRSLDGYDRPPTSIAFEFARMRLMALLEDAWDDGYITAQKIPIGRRSAAVIEFPKCNHAGPTARQNTSG